MRRDRLDYAVIGTLAALALWLAFLATVAWAGPVPYTVAFDLRNLPDWHAMADSGFSAAVISPRAQTRRSGFCGDSLRAHGLKVLLHAQPWPSVWKGRPVVDWPLDAALWNAIPDSTSWLRDSAGAVVRVQEPGMSDPSPVPDFAQAEVAEAWGRALADYWPAGDGWFLDYGDLRGLGWCVGMGGVTWNTWQAWSAGYRLMAARLRVRGEVSCGCGPECYSLCSIGAWEAIGPYQQNIYSYERVLKACLEQRAAGGHGLIFCQRADVPTYRRVTACMALLSDSWFNWLDGAMRNRRDPEHFDLSLGVGAPDWWSPAPGVYRRMFQRGLVIVNLSAAAYAWNGRTIAPQDALAAQLVIGSDGRLAWRTNEGR